MVGGRNFLCLANRVFVWNGNTRKKMVLALDGFPSVNLHWPWLLFCWVNCIGPPWGLCECDHHHIRPHICLSTKQGVPSGSIEPPKPNRAWSHPRIEFGWIKIQKREFWRIEFGSVWATFYSYMNWSNRNQTDWIGQYSRTGAYGKNCKPQRVVRFQNWIKLPKIVLWAALNKTLSRNTKLTTISFNSH